MAKVACGLGCEGLGMANVVYGVWLRGLTYQDEVELRKSRVSGIDLPMGATLISSIAQPRAAGTMKSLPSFRLLWHTAAE